MAGTTRETVKQWLETAQAEGATHMLVVVDTYDYEDYPVNILPQHNFWNKHAMCSKDMQRVMEVYDLALDLELQLNETRAHHPPERS